MDIGTLRLVDFVTPPCLFHAMRHHIRPGAGGLHRHDFSELFWVERGPLTYWPDGKPLRLEAGDMVFVRPERAHGFSGEAVIVNVAFAAATMRDLQARHGAGGAWDRAPDSPYHLPEALGELAAAFATLLSGPPDSRLNLESFLLRCMALALLAVPAGRGEAPPEWLQAALGKFRALPSLPPGTAPFVKLAGRCPEHVGRCVHKAFGRTLSELLGDIRVDEAARRLAGGDAKIHDVAWGCGFRNLGHFYAQFKRRKGVAPRRFRLDRARILAGGAKTC